MSGVQLKLHLDFDGRLATFMTREPLDVKPTVIQVPFTILKAALSQVLKAEAEDELTIMQERGALAEQQPEQKIEVVKG